MEHKIVYGRFEAYHPDLIGQVCGEIHRVGVTYPVSSTVVFFLRDWLVFAAPPSALLVRAVRRDTKKQPMALFYRAPDNDYGSLLVNRNGLAHPEGVIAKDQNEMPVDVWEKHLSFWRAYFDDTHTLN